MLISDGSGTDSKMRRASVKIINKNKVVNALKAKAKKGKVILINSLDKIDFN